MLGQVIAELLKEVSSACESLSLIDRWMGEKKQYDELKMNLESLQDRVKRAKLESQEIPILQKITTQHRTKKEKESAQTATAKGSVKVNPVKVEAGLDASLSDFDKTLDDTEIYNEYSDVVYKSFPFSEILDEIKELLSESGLTRLVIFFDDFSELGFLDQRLFVDVILSPFNNSSNETVKLKIAGYPGRIYYGKIDPTKVDIINLDFAELYEASEVQEMENSAIDYTTRLLDTRFKAFGTSMEEFFDVSLATIDDYMKLVFQASFNVPRIMGHLLHYCFLDRVSKDQKITLGAIKLASRKYYEQTVIQYFDRMHRYALEPFEN
ncbi:MAG: transcriptional regulator, partial [Candidatus Omnitrophica bacterium]|nr:transcriptional regulator [Candidatus Omnitrophota bacterium]